MNNSFEIELEKVLPTVPSAHDPCVTRLIGEMGTLYGDEITIYLKPTLSKGLWIHKLRLTYSRDKFSEFELRESIFGIGEKLSQEFHHSYWVLFQALSQKNKAELLAKINDVDMVNFAALDNCGFLCVEYDSFCSDSDFKALDELINRSLEDYFASKSEP